MLNQERDVTIEQAADILNVSTQYIRKLLDDGELQYHKLGPERRIVFSHLMDYKDKRDAARSKALKKLYRISEEAGLYEINEFPPEED